MAAKYLNSCCRHSLTAENGTNTEEIYTVKDYQNKEHGLDIIRSATVADQEMKILSSVIMAGWPNDRHDVPPEARPYFHYRDDWQFKMTLCTKETGLWFQSQCD